MQAANKLTVYSVQLAVVEFSPLAKTDLDCRLQIFACHFKSVREGEPQRFLFFCCDRGRVAAMRGRCARRSRRRRRRRTACEAGCHLPAKRASAASPPRTSSSFVKRYTEKSNHSAPHTFQRTRTNKHPSFQIRFRQRRKLHNCQLYTVN